MIGKINEAYILECFLYFSSYGFFLVFCSIRKGTKINDRDA